MKTLRALIGLFFIVAVVYSAWKLVPPYFHDYQFQDVVSEEARMNTYTARNETDIRESVFKKAQDLDIPITREQINVRREGQTVNISVDYIVHVDLPAYPLDLKFHAGSRNKAY